MNFYEETLLCVPPCLRCGHHHYYLQIDSRVMDDESKKRLNDAWSNDANASNVLAEWRFIMNVQDQSKDSMVMGRGGGGQMWWARLSYTPTIQVRILLKTKVLFLCNCLKSRNEWTRRQGWQRKKDSTVKEIFVCTRLNISTQRLASKEQKYLYSNPRPLKRPSHYTTLI